MQPSQQLLRAAGAHQPHPAPSTVKTQNLTVAKYKLLAGRGMLPGAPQAAEDWKVALKVYKAAHPHYRKVTLTIGWHGQVTSVYPAGKLPANSEPTTDYGPEIARLQAEIARLQANTQPLPVVTHHMPVTVQAPKPLPPKQAAKVQARRIDRTRQLEALRASLPAHLR